MNIMNVLILLTLAVIIILGAYQVYFFPQNHPIKEALVYPNWFDDIIPFKPHFIWIYSFIYYPFIVSIVLAVNSLSEFVYVSTSFLILIFVHVIFFFLFPVSTPLNWRNYDKDKNLSTKFLSFVQGYDKASNCFPSMHVAIATLSAAHLTNLLPQYGMYFYSIPLLITLSCLFTKQHYILDTVGGAVTGKVAFALYLLVQAS